MKMKVCTKCNVTKDDTEFSPQKTKPIFKYAWCDGCREEAKVEKDTVFIRRNAAVKEDYDKMRAKAVEMRKFSPEQCVELKRRIDAGEKPKALATEFSTVPSTIYRASRNYS
jgi:hypothetical protein